MAHLTKSNFIGAEPTCPEEICGNPEFSSVVNEEITLIQRKDGLKYGTDAWLLASYVKGHYKTCVDLGCGTGIIGLLLCKMKKTSALFGVEVQSVYADLAGRNALANGVDMTVICKNVKDVTSRDFPAEVDLVVANPPYMSTASGRHNESEEKYIARHEATGNINDFIACASRILKFGGDFVCVYRPDRLVDLFDAMRTRKIEPKTMTMVYADTDTPPSMVLVQGKKGGSASLRNEPPLILYDKYEKESGRVLSEKAERIYETGEFVR